VVRLLHLILLALALAATTPAHACGGEAVAATAAHSGHHGEPTRTDDQAQCRQALCCGLAELPVVAALAAPIVPRVPDRAILVSALSPDSLARLDPPPPRAG
jgi:hypothetical protein